MTQPDSQAPRPNADYRWTPAKAMAFLDALASCGKVAAAARRVGMTRQSAYRLKARSALVAQAWPLALAAGRERRGLRGQERGLQERGLRGQGLQERGQGDALESHRSQGCTGQGDTMGAAR